MPLQGRCRVMANKMPYGTRNVIGHMTTDLVPVRATRKKNILDFHLVDWFSLMPSSIYGPEDVECSLVTYQDQALCLDFSAL